MDKEDVISLSSDSSRCSSPSNNIGQSGGLNNVTIERPSPLNLENDYSFEFQIESNSSKFSKLDDPQLLSRIAHTLSDSNESDCEFPEDDHLLEKRLQTKYGKERKKVTTSQYMDFPPKSKSYNTIQMVRLS